MIKRIHYILPLLFLSVLVFNKVLAQPINLQLNQLSTNEGLSSSRIISMTQDSSGFMWIGTSAGLNRYDGQNFKVYRAIKSDTNSLADNLILSLYLTENDNLYIGTNGGLTLYDPANDQFRNLTKDSSSCFFDFSFQVRKITGDRKGNLYLATNIGLIIFNTNSNSYEVFIHDPEKPNSISNSMIEEVLFDSSGKLWVGTRMGLNLFDPDTKTFRRIYKGINGEDFSQFRFLRIVEDLSGSIWICSNKNGLFCIDNFNESEKLKQFVNHRDDPNSISANRLLSVLVDKQNNLWIGAENDGLFLFNPEKQNFKHYLNRESDPYSMKTYSVECLYLDSSENLWIGTFANGVNVSPANSDAIISYEKFKGGDLTIANNVVNYFIEDDDGKMWIATDGGGINLFDKKTSLFTNLNTKNSQIPNDYITSMLEAENHIIWMTSWGDGLIRYDSKNNTFKSYNTRNSKIQDDNIFAIEKGFNNDFWLASFSNGLIHFEPEKNDFTSFDNAKTQLEINYINVIRAAADGVLYFGSSRGFYSYTPQSGQFEKFTLSEETAETMSNLHVYDIFVENDSCIWVGTLMGLNCFNPKTGKNLKFTVKDGLPSNIISGIIAEESGKLWVSTNSGLCQFNPSNKEFKSFTKADGLQSNEFRPKSAFKDRNGALYFGGFNGFDVVHPEKFITNTRIPKVQITGLELFNKSIVPNTSGSPLKEIISKTKEIKLKYNQSVITFHFAVMDFTRPQKNKHAYFLENFDKDWTYCGNRRSVTYTNLDPGKYVFRVKGANNDGYWSEEGTSLVIIISPPWWKTWIFRIIVVILILVLTYIFYSARVSSLKKQKRLLEEKVERRTSELASINATKDKLFSIIAHDLRSPFNSILGFTELLHNDFKSFDEKTIKVILSDLKESSENAYVLLKNLLDWSAMQRGTIEFKPVLTNASDVLKRSIQLISGISKKKNIEIVNKIEKQGRYVYADENMLALVFRNLLTNAIKFSGDNSKVIVDVKDETSDFVTFTVTDSGVGIAADKISSLFSLKVNSSTIGTKGEKGTGLGLPLCAEFIEKHSGKIWVESELGKGSTFNFVLRADPKLGSGK